MPGSVLLLLRRVCSGVILWASVGIGVRAVTDGRPAFELVGFSLTAMPPSSGLEWWPVGPSAWLYGRVCNVLLGAACLQFG